MSASMDLFVSRLFSDNAADRFYFLAVALTVVISIVLHELAHGWAAIRLGDHTPRRLGRMTGNPLVHMGPWSLLMLVVAGIAWGQMPIDRTRLRGRHAEAIVAGVGPAMNVLLAAVALAMLAGLLHLWGFAEVPVELFMFETPGISVTPPQSNAIKFLLLFGVTNLLLAMFNLFPVPPLDGSHIVANYSRPYTNFVGAPKHQGFILMLFVFGFLLAGQVLIAWAWWLATAWVGLLT